jgi:hypothetical protein
VDVAREQRRADSSSSFLTLWLTAGWVRQTRSARAWCPSSATAEVLELQEVHGWRF